MSLRDALTDTLDAADTQIATLAADLATATAEGGEDACVHAGSLG